ncbi:unnamed protein product [marine sediment metagenome]|uniref:Uncharacterized protein n=1 Tax=marine sediment metagenome TaxID=412755 RepID=X1DLW8_9ZZZZ
MLGDWLVLFGHMQCEAVFLAQKEGNIRIGDFIFYKFVGGNKKAAQVGCPDDCLEEIRGEADGVQSFDKFPLGCDEVIAEYIYFFRLRFAFLVELLYKQAQSFLSLFVVHEYSLFLIVQRSLEWSSNFKFGLTKEGL